MAEQQYFSDRDDAEASGKAMARALARLVEFLKAMQDKGLRCDQRVHLVVHSMGILSSFVQISYFISLNQYVNRFLFPQDFVQVANR